MGRPRRAGDGGLVYHLLNRANARMTIFEKSEDYVAFVRVLEEAVAGTKTRLLAAWPRPRLAGWVEQVNAPQTEAELSALRRSVKRGCPFGSGTRRRTQGLLVSMFVSQATCIAYPAQ